MREEIQQKSSGEKPREKASLGVVQAAEAGNDALPHGSDSEKIYRQDKTAGSSERHEEIIETRQSVDRLNFSFTPSGFLLLLLWIYRKTISPWLPPCCRFTPSCSHYAVEAVRLHGAWKGFWLAFWRVMRCQPFCKGGYDPVPQPKKKRLTELNERLFSEA
jgi:putative membrane protein insertion efficiency factor